MDSETIFEYIPCNSCKSSNFTVLFEAKTNLNETNLINRKFHSSSESPLEEQLVRCNMCSLVYVNPRLRSDIISNSYQQAEDSRHVSQDSYRYKSFKKALMKLSKVQVFAEYLEKNATVLDVGCAGGAFLSAASDAGFQTVGLEPSAYLADYGRRKLKLPIYAKTLEEYNPPNASLDVITMWDVLEHVLNPAETLRRINLALKNNGILILNLPMIDTFPARVLGRKWPFYLSVHLYYFEAATISNLLKANGFKVIYSRRYFQCLSLGYALQRAGIRFLPRIVSSIPIWYYMGQRTILAQKSNAL